MQLQITLFLIVSLFRLALAQDARPNFTDLLSINAITADIALLDKINNDTLVFFDAAKHFYTKHYSTTDHFRHTKHSTIEERSTMAAIMNTTREFLLSIVNQTSNIDASNCEFGEYVAVICEEPHLPLEEFFGILIEEYLRTARCAKVIAQILERQDTLSRAEAQISWYLASHDPQEQAPSFWRDPDLQWQWQWAKNIHTEEGRNPAQEPQSSDELNERLQTFSHDLEVLDRAFWTSLQSNYAHAIVERMYTTVVDANGNTKAMLILLNSPEGRDERFVSEYWPAVEVYWATMCRQINLHPPVASEDRGMVFMW
jgi:hypothetical protein